MSSAIQTLSVEAPLVSVLCLWPFNTARLLQPVPGSRSLKGHCHGHISAFLVKLHQNYDIVLSTMQEMLLELKGEDI